MRKECLSYIFSMLLMLFFQSCGKSWLEAKPDKSLVVPKSIGDYQALLDNTSQIFNVNQACGLGEIGAGDFYITSSSWQNLFTIQEKSAYIWAPTKEFYNGEQSLDWTYAYQRILNANVILEGIEKITPITNDQQDWNSVKGSALFFRAFDFFNLIQEYCVPYNSRSASGDLGLPLRLEYDVNIKVKRSNLQQTYERIIIDLKEAINLLGAKSGYKTRPSKEAAYALLAKTYLAMENYDQAGVYADLALKIQPDLMDYTKLNSSISFPIAKFNSEVIFHSTFSYGIFNASRLIVVPELYNDYTIEDCRKSIFFTASANGMTFKGSYNGDKTFFGGLATDEMYLIRSECNARNGNLTLALEDLNRLRRTRWKGLYLDLISTNPNTVLDYILKERRKELIFRGIRWSDLRRLNGDTRLAVTLTRVLNGNSYTLQPNDKRYVFPIDEEEIRLSEIQQNER
ncbi:MAG: RagB/SusD family nutrient uptake outer membrane protein [Candidatus Pedobacter colombiensis]|uniref:RagB/SusD family nutrient uptake outer membrane protein n=1 Tax=Candidatus Pedobacter colombiensis TaxID=3121371 RepID=A0AAJ5W7H8_9SPHI|nr:RagB/SusD family nutrient uptake outer membrane protein [Pedobacter sp.]WEK18611.1 MAG: RagB/SusD family nutrient uptake outer membrane protein [Pedobacter sp.]